MADITSERSRYLDFVRFNLYANLSSNSGARARLTWGLINGNPRITVFTNDPSDTVDNKVIPFNMTFEVMYIVFDLLEKIAKHQGEVKYVFEYSRRVYENNKPTNETVKVSNLIIGKDNEGMCWMSVIASNRPQIKFEFTIGNQTVIYGQNGEPLRADLVSAATVLGTIKGLQGAYAGVLSDIFMNPPPREDSKPINNGPIDANKSFDSDVLF